jgi:hypothetical protein
MGYTKMVLETLEQLQPVFNLGISLVAGTLGWVLRTIYGNIRDLERDFANLRETVARDYVTSDRMRDAFETISRQLNRIEDKLDHKVDKK